MRILIIPDCHVTPGQNLQRFKHLGNVVVQEKPDVIINMGDFLSLSSVSHWDSSKKLTMEGRRYREEVKAGCLALNILEKPIKELQARQKEQKVKQYKPKMYFLLGNHEYWVDKYLEQNPQLEGHIDIIEDLQLRKRGWNVISYKHYLEINDILFTHVPLAANQQPVSGKYALHNALALSSKSLVFAHTHRLETVNVKRHGHDELIQGLTCGCFFEGEDEYAEGGANHYWRGVVMLDIYKPGRFDVQSISLERIYAYTI